MIGKCDHWFIRQKQKRQSQNGQNQGLQTGRKPVRPPWRTAAFQPGAEAPGCAVMLIKNKIIP
jgi:hypothetical protein